ncbi:MAG TPA: LysR family transcriptional regulator [Rubrivivax sp.]|nr:LysR family transcriptional regulator [Rubrivivax sp.]
MALNFRQLDLNLLRVLCAIHRTGSVTEAGHQLALSQSATSNALARLRHCFGDALFVRSPSGLRPTQLAQRIAPVVATQLRELETALCRGESFDPQTDSVHWRLSLSDLGEMMFLPTLARRMRRLSPASRITNEAVDAARVSAALESREIDLAIGMLVPEQQGVVAELLFREHYVALSARDWQPLPAVAGRRLEKRQLAHAALALAAPTASLLGSVQQVLERLDLSATSCVRLRHYGAVAELVRDTDMLAIVPEMFASAEAERHDLRVWELPDGVGYDVMMLWHESVDGDPAQRWLREQVRSLFGAGPHAANEAALAG